MTIPRVLISVRLPDHKWSASDCLTCVIDTGSNFNILHLSALPKETKIDKSTKTSLRAVNGSVTEFLGTTSLKIQFINPVTFHSINNSERDCLFHITDSLPITVILGMPLLHNCVIENQFKRLTMKIKRKTISIPFAQNFSFFNQEAFLSTDVDQHYYQSHVDKNLEKYKTILKNVDDKASKNSLRNVQINPVLPQDAQDEIRMLIERYRHVFQVRTDVGSLFKNGAHEPLKIHLSSRVFQPLAMYPIPEATYPELEKQLEDWLRAGIIEEASDHSEFLSPLKPVPKKSGETRFCLDTRAINSITIPIRCHPPKIMDLVRKASGHKYYTCLDIASFFLSFRLDEASRPLVSFQSPINGKIFQFAVSIFGLRNSMENAIILMQNEMSSIEGAQKFMVNYVDDVCIFHDNLSDHLFDVERVLQKLESCNLKLKPSKVEFAMNECDLFGFRLNSKGFTVSPSKKTAILKIPEPKTKKELETILGKASYYRNLLPPKPGMGYSKTAMYNFTLLQRLLPSDQHLIVRSDASHSHWAGSLAAVRNGKEVHIFNVSKAFAGPALRYAICRKELVGALMTLYEFKDDLYGRETVEVHTDNASCFYLLTHPEKIVVDSQVFQNMFYNIRHIRFKPVRVSGKTADWDLIDRLSRSGKQIKISSRNVEQLLTIEDDPHPEDLVCLADLRPVHTRVNGRLLTAPLFELKVLEQIKAEIKNDPDYIKNNIVPEHLRPMLLRSLHQIGHIGVVRMASILTNNGITWKKRNADIELTVRQCNSCSMRKPNNRPLNCVTNVINVLEPKTCVCIDVSTVGQPAAFHTLVMIDEYTHFITARRIVAKLSYVNVANTLLTMLAAYAPMCRVIRLDNASYFNKDFEAFLASLGIRCSFAARSSSRANGRVERGIFSVSQQFMFKLEEFPHLNEFRPNEIDLLLETICLFINMTHKNHGITPYTLTYGRQVIYNELEFPSIDSSNLNIYEQRLTNRIQSLQKIIKISMDKPQKSDTSGLFKPGDLVRIRTYQKVGQNKLQRLYFSAHIFEIKTVVTNRRTYKLQNVRDENDIRIVPDRHCRLVLKSEERQMVDNEKPKIDKAYDEYKNAIINETQQRKSSQPIQLRKGRKIRAEPEQHPMTLRKRS